MALTKQLLRWSQPMSERSHFKDDLCHRVQCQPGPVFMEDLTHRAPLWLDNYIYTFGVDT